MSTPPPLTSTYDALPYVSNAFTQTHPERLGVMGRIFGLNPAPAAQCRVLEIGCASGGNLLPMGAQYPESTFVGIDLSGRQITDGKNIIADAGITNVDLRHLDMMQVDDALGQFDYIIAHGVFSWIPRAVQDKLLAICKSNLAPQGVAFVSYNTYPGWRMRGMVRDMMNYHAARFPDMTTRVQQARALLDFLAQNVPTENNPYGLMLKQEVEMLRQTDESYLAHEHLEEVNEPLYFYQFAERIADHGLQYLGEADFHTMLASNFPPQVTETLKSIAPNIVQMEQYMDFLRNRPFRQSLLVHQNVALNRNLDWRHVHGFHASSPLRSEEGTTITTAVEAKFTIPGGAGLISREPIVKAGLSVLQDQWPQSVPVDALPEIARAKLAVAGEPGTPADASRDREILGSELLRCFAAGIVELRRAPVPGADRVSERPRANGFARFQAARSNHVVNLRHERCTIDEFGRRLLTLLDGNLDSAALEASMQELISRDVMLVRQGETTVRDPAVIKSIVQQSIPRTLEAFRRSALLEA